MSVKREPKRIDAPMEPVDPQNQTAFGAYPSLTDLLKAVQELNRTLIIENDALKTENFELWRLTETQEERIELCEKKHSSHLRSVGSIGPVTGDEIADKALKIVYATLPIIQQRQASSNAMRARQARTDAGSALVKNKALALYDARNWDSIVAAAKTIFPEVQIFANALARRQSLSESRFPVTLGGWIRNR